MTVGRLLSWIFHVLPLAWTLAFGRLLGRLGWLARIRRRIVLDNLALAFPEKSEAERREIARRTWLNLGMLVPELLRSPRLTAEEVRALIEIDGWEHAEAALAEGRGVIVATAHFGNWEFLATGMAILGLPLHVITRKISQARFNRYWKEARARAGLHEIADRRSVREVIGVLRRGEVLGVVVDQNMRPPRGIFVPFFGRQAATLTVPAVMAERTGAPILTAFMVRKPGGKHHLTVRPYVYERVGEDRAENVRYNTARLNEILEDWIRRHPDHWLWLHRRWKTRPPEEGSDGAIVRNRAA